MTQTFSDLGVTQTIVDALTEQKIINPTEIQAASLPAALRGEDIIGRSMTGSGKTLAFSIPIISVLENKAGKGVKALILAPTRELAKQVDEEFVKASKHTQIKTAIIYGGVAYEPQFEQLEQADVVIGTPGRILDHIEKGTLKLDNIEFFVLDEADRMLDMGFIIDIKRIIENTPQHKQNFFFSATMPKEARELAESFMHDAKLVNGTTQYVANDKLEEYYVNSLKLHKASTLLELIKREQPDLAIVFVNTRAFADGLCDYLKQNDVSVRSLHGGHAQNKREKIVQDFDAGKIHVLIATDVAARGLDIEGVSHVFNFEVPKDEQDYTHRIGRTARAGRSGKAITILEPEEHHMFARIEGDSLRNISLMRLEDFRSEKVYLLPKRESRGPQKGRTRSKFHKHNKPGRHANGRQHRKNT